MAVICRIIYKEGKEQGIFEGYNRGYKSGMDRGYLEGRKSKPRKTVKI